MRFALHVFVAATACLSIGCVERKLTITSEPDGALLVLNNQEIGRTPVTRDFLWYGNYEVQLRRDGYETIKTSKQMIAPWWQWVPFDLLAEVTPFRWTDAREMHFTMQTATTQSLDSNELLQRADSLRSQMQSSENTRQRTTQPTTLPNTR